MASALEIINEEIEAARHRLKDGPILVDGQTLNDILSTLAHKMRTRVQQECPDGEEGHPCLNCREMIGSPDSCCSVECDEEYTANAQKRDPICPHGVDLRDEACPRCGLNVGFP